MPAKTTDKKTDIGRKRTEAIFGKKAKPDPAFKKWIGELDDGCPVLYHHFLQFFEASGGQDVNKFVEEESEALSQRVDGRENPPTPFGTIEKNMSRKKPAHFEELGFGLWLRGYHFSMWLLPVSWQRAATHSEAAFVDVEGHPMIGDRLAENTYRSIFGCLPAGFIVGSAEAFCQTIEMIGHFAEFVATKPETEDEVADQLCQLRKAGWDPYDLVIFLRDRAMHVGNCRKLHFAPEQQQVAEK